ncbi:ATP-grasp domain-containing protein [Halomonas sp. AOP12-C2-37]|uniref:ATP-grasp domain-containing protein n=1 Tax=Halomonas casei TaxID=2742613 RepID=A0ABR9EXL3_9GAMM|nr:ATP-grasp domain-containing protein [Halomonas casei]MBE0398963.1 ATP-grasp domain-containing protein [Halomonas casei]
MSDAFWPKGFRVSQVKPAFGNKLCSYTITLEAWRRGLNVKILDSGFDRFEISDSNKVVSFNRSRASLNSPEAVKNVINKQTARGYFEKAGVATPLGSKFSVSEGFSPIEKYASQIGYPVVLKPVSGSLGKGVITNIKNADSLLDDYNYLTKELRKNNIVLERHVEGEDYRVFVIGKKASAVVKRVPANVVGDGKRTIKELINAKNIIRKKNPFLSKGLIKVDREVLWYISYAGFSIDSILRDGEFLQLRGKANASAGGDVVDVTDTISDDVKKLAISAIHSIPGLFQGGVDVLYDSVSGSCNVIEINSRAQIGVNMYPTDGFGANVPKDIIDEIFPDSTRPKNQFYNRLIFDMKSTLHLIKNGVAKEITLTPPRYRRGGKIKSVMLTFEFDDDALLKGIISKAQALELNGKVETEGSHALILVSSSASRIGKFIAVVNSALQVEVSERKWKGTVCQGFFVDNRFRN